MLHCTRLQHYPIYLLLTNIRFIIFSTNSKLYRYRGIAINVHSKYIKILKSSFQKIHENSYIKCTDLSVNTIDLPVCLKNMFH